MYLLGPVGGGKSSLAERLKALMELHPDLRAEGRRPAQPGVRKPARAVRSRAHGHRCWKIATAFPQRRLTGLMSPWCVKRLDEFDGDISRFRVAKLIPRGCVRSPSPRPSRATRTTRTSPRWSARSISASWSCTRRTIRTPTATPAGLNRANQGLLEFVEMFKAPIKMLHPLLTATQEGNYIGTENIGAIPFQRHHPGPLQRGGVADLQEQPQQRSLHRPNLRDQGAVLPARDRRAEDLRQAGVAVGAGGVAVRAGDAGDAGPLLGADPAAAARELDPVRQDAGL